MTLAKLVEICKESGLPLAPLAVTRLELNCQLFTRIGECIAEYRHVFMAGRGRPHPPLAYGLNQLRLLDLSGNELTTLAGLAGLPSLEALLLDLGHNQLYDGDAVLQVRHVRIVTSEPLGRAGQGLG
ncbi:hypothetical protein GPECTOR_41g696 [Gonium pectorale]|uniref:Uncharacterized protein n=1 Tax=Gonium pectorale TaxID=33097 RepID=A0A150GA61_GONPE|nr:hypothetical protein GPECTOR_41g696 [Gonium pectorale]|eukprot:KXZ46731.1 hypothetical protein GPECTOR_41g696 [Gonium pectorale]